jgi:hypothetical protein
MKPPPSEFGDLQLAAYSPVDWRHKATGNCRHSVEGKELGEVAGLAICREPSGDGFYLFYCNEHWEPLTDTWHQSLEDAMRQAEFEYSGVAGTWERAA